ncbi:MAG: alkyl hydroperoxide reductase [Planctomycetota bacterium]|nr:MAG: alkyl hydroperoxide reductase [Planctomycetota bacterium]
MQATCRTVIAIALLAIFSLPARAEEKSTPETQVAIGDKVDNFEFKDIRYLPRTLSEFGDKKAFVVMFTTLDCPLVQRYLPKLGEMEREYRDQGVQFLAVNVGPNDDIREVAYQAMRAECSFPFAKDFDGDVARAVGAERAAEVVVLDGDHKLRYRGRVDDQYRFGGERPKVGRHDLKLAIEDVLAGRDVKVATTAVDGCVIEYPQPREGDPSITFAEHISPLLQKHCQDCHRDGATEAPFALVSYDDAVDHSEMLLEVTKEQRMPPWYGSKQHGTFTNLRGMSLEERHMIEDWVRADCPQGDMTKAPEPRQFSDSEWKISEPDLVLKTPVQKIPATGYIPYRYIILPHFFKEDTWIQEVQIKAENSRAMHHCNMAYIKLGEKPSNKNFITGQVPGGDPMILDRNVGFMIPAKSSLVLQIHYVTLGEETTDQISVGLGYAREVIHKHLRNSQVTNLTFKVPPHAPHHEVSATRELKHDITGYGLFSHMHLRGKDMTFSAILPDGKKEKLLVVPNYSFDWQQAYRWPEDAVKFPKGTKLEVVAHYDNSAFNPYNPDPSDEVKEGPQTIHEMMYGFVFYTHDDEHLNLHIDPKTGHVIDAANQQAAK